MQNHTRFDGPDRRSSEEISSDPAKSSRSARSRHPSVWGTSLDTQQRDTPFKGLKKELKKDIDKLKKETGRVTPKVSPELWWSQWYKLKKAPMPDNQLKEMLETLDPLIQRAQSLQEKIIGVYDNAQDAKQVGQMLKDTKQSIDKLKEMQNFLLEKHKERMDRIQSKFQGWMDKEEKFIDDHNRHMIDQNMPEESRKREMAARKDVFNKNKKELEIYLIKKMNEEKPLSSIYESICGKIEGYEHCKYYSIKWQIRDMLQKGMNKMIEQWIDEEKKSIEDHSRYMVDQNMSEESRKREMTLKLKVCDDYKKSLHTSMNGMLKHNKSESEIVQKMERIKENYNEQKENLVARKRTEYIIPFWQECVIEELDKLLEDNGWKGVQVVNALKEQFSITQKDLGDIKDKMRREGKEDHIIQKKLEERIKFHNEQKNSLIQDILGNKEQIENSIYE